MATKTSIISAINGFITSVVNITKVRNAFLQLINELYQTVVTQTLATGTNVFWHDLRYKKQGNITYLSGKITNKYTITKNGTTMVTIPNTELYAKTGVDTIFMCPTSDGQLVQVSISLGTIYLIGNLAPNQELRLNIHYENND